MMDGDIVELSSGSLLDFGPASNFMKSAIGGIDTLGRLTCVTTADVLDGTLQATNKPTAKMILRDIVFFFFIGMLVLIDKITNIQYNSLMEYFLYSYDQPISL